VGHATVLLQLDGLNILTDPHWSQRASPFSFIGPKRHQPPGVAFDDLPPIHAVLISHNHFDHLDEDTLKRLTARHSNTVRFYVPLGVQHWMQANIPGAVVAGPGQNVFALDWDDTLQLPGQSAPVELQFLAVQHWSARTPWDRYKTLWGSWAVLHPQFRFWFSGDLALSPDTADIGQKLGTLDLAAIAIGAYEPRWFMKDAHVNPAEAIQVMQDVHAKSALGIHWGTFEGLTDESLDQPPQDLARELATYPAPQPDFFVLRHGQTKRYGDF
jgi:L-ascorbate metabolism protein UlaG (beta-lactamase superfamily)